jgi:hypothetical protein
MPDVVSATCTDPGGSSISTDYGERVVGDFKLKDGSEVSVWVDDDTKEASALRNLQEGQSLPLIRQENGDSEYYTLRDSDIEEMSGVTANGRSSHPEATQNAGTESDTEQLMGLAKEHARLIANTYAFLDKQFSEKAEHINQNPSSADIQKMAVSAAIEATDE